MKHECSQMLRSYEIQTIIGQQAYKLYCLWLEKQRRKPPAIEGFTSSAYYSSFIKFAQWTRDTSIPDPTKYVELMISEKLSPSLWKRNEAYQIYLEYVDRRSNPYEQVGTSIETIISMSGGLEIEHGEVFKRFSVGEIIELIQQRRLSPWLLFCSRSFKSWSESLHESEHRDLMKSINIHYWSEKLEKSPELVREIREIAEQLGI